MSAEQILSNTAEWHLASAKKSQTPGDADRAELDDENLVYTVIRPIFSAHRRHSNISFAKINYQMSLDQK